MSASSSGFDMEWFGDFLSTGVIGEMRKNRERGRLREGETGGCGERLCRRESSKGQ